MHHGQVLYPDLPRGAAEGAREQDVRVAQCLDKVGLAQLLSGYDRGLDTFQQDWLEVLSGGEKQRVGLARLLYHSHCLQYTVVGFIVINFICSAVEYQHLPGTTRKPY